VPDRAPQNRDFNIRNENGRHVATHHKKVSPEGKKTFRWSVPGKGAGLHGQKVAALPLYGAHLVKDWPEDEPVVGCEGEMAADALLAVGLKAVGTVTGAGGCPSRASLGILKDRVVILWGDNDELGRKHMERLARELQGIAAEVRVFTWHEAPEKGDAADHPAVVSRDEEGLDRLLNDLLSAPRYEGGKEESKKGNAPATITAKDLMAREFPPLRYAVPGIVPEGVTLLAGKPKLGKSWMALGFIVAVASGGYALGKVQVEEGDALICALEDNDRRVQRRLGKVLNGEAAPEGLHVTTTLPRLDEGGVEALQAWLERHPQARLIVLDTLAKVRPRTRGSNVYADDYGALERLLPLASEYGVAILVVHHLRKMGADDPTDAISGSTGLVGGVDGTLVLKRDRGQADAYLHVDGRDVEEARELALTWDRQTASWILAGDADEFRLSKERKEVLRTLREAGKPLGPKDVEAALGKKSGTATRKLMSDMAKDGLLRREEHGKYVPATAHTTHTAQFHGENGE